MNEVEAAAGHGRVRLHFTPSDKEIRVPPGVTVFDAASWNGIAIDSTCGGHGTCKKCKVRVVEGKVALSPVDPRAFSIEELKAGWRLACRAGPSSARSAGSPWRRSRAEPRRCYSGKNPRLPGPVDVAALTPSAAIA